MVFDGGGWVGLGFGCSVIYFVITHPFKMLEDVQIFIFLKSKVLIFSDRILNQSTFRLIAITYCYRVLHFFLFQFLCFCNQTLLIDTGNL